MIRTVTYDTATHKIVPIEPTEAMNRAGYNAQDFWPSHQCDNQKELAHSFSMPRYKAMIAAAPEYQEPENPLDTPLPCDIRIGAGTIKKGCKLSVLVRRMNVLYQMAMKTQLGIGEPVNQDHTKDDQ